MRYMRLLPFLTAAFPLLLGCNAVLDVGDGDGGSGNGDGGPCEGLRCQVPRCDNGGTTTLTGVVNIPAGNLPLYNATVYVPNAKVAPIGTGASCDRCDQALSGDPITKTTTDIRGRFTLTGVPAGKDIPLVIVAGKWRRQVTIPSVTSCQSAPVDAGLTRLPRNQAEGDIPRFALSTGGADAMECLLRKLGIDDKEFTTEAGTGRVHLYGGNGGTNKFAPTLNNGASLTASQRVPTASWWDKVENLTKYDVLVLSCEGAQNLDYKSTTSRANLQSYINAGGRVFASHWHNAWLQGAPMPLASVATWGGSNDLMTISANIDAPANMPEDRRNAFADWMVNVGASTQRGVFQIQNAKRTVQTINASLTQRWVYYQPNPMTTSPQYFLFNAPVGAAPDQQCGRMVFSDIHVTGATGGDTSKPDKPFPTGCTTTMLTAQEKALIFMLFDLSNCLDPIIG